MLSRLLSAICILISVECLTQGQPNPFMVDGNGFPLKWGSTYVSDGSPYYHEEYNWAEITIASGKIYKDIRVKINLLDAQVQYLAEDGTEMVTTMPVICIKFPYLSTPEGARRNVTLRSDTGTVNGPNATTYEVIDSGKVSILKKIIVTSRDEKKYNEAVTTRSFTRKETDYVLLPSGQAKKFEKSMEFLLEILNDKIKEVNAYIEKTKLRCKTFKECQSIISYYNTL
jgi:hypothetical protein